MHKLSRNALNVLAYLKQQEAAKAYAPSRKEIAAATGIKSTGTVQRLLVRLRDVGYIELGTGGAARAIRVVDLTNGKQ